MKKTALGLVLAMFAGAAAAGDLSEQRYDSNDYSAKVYYRVDFGGASGPATQSVGLRFDNERAHAAGAPAMLQARFGAQGLNTLALNGVDLRGAYLAANQAEGGGFFANLTVAQWVALGFTAVVLGVAVSEAVSDDEPSTTGTN